MYHHMVEFFWRVCQCFEFKISDQLAFVCNDEKCPWGASSDKIGVQCGAQEKASFALGKYFKHASFRPGQLDAVLPALHRKDVLVRMATGSGKSLCMYLVPLASGNSAVGIIISPLIGLIGQQVRISVKCTMWSQIVDRCSFYGIDSICSSRYTVKNRISALEGSYCCIPLTR